MDCKCHGERAYWNRDMRKPTGGYWQCAVAKRQRERDWYDRDPIHRIGKCLKNNRRERVATLKRKREEHLGKVPLER